MLLSTSLPSFLATSLPHWCKCLKGQVWLDTRQCSVHGWWNWSVMASCIVDSSRNLQSWRHSRPWCELLLKKEWAFSNDSSMQYTGHLSILSNSTVVRVCWGVKWVCAELTCHGFQVGEWPKLTHCQRIKRQGWSLPYSALVAILRPWWTHMKLLQVGTTGQPGQVQVCNTILNLAALAA